MKTIWRCLKDVLCPMGYYVLQNLNFLQYYLMHFFPYLSLRKLSLFYNRKLKILALFIQVFHLLANIMVPFFLNTKFFWLFQISLFYYLVCGYNYGGNLPTPFEIKLNHELIWSRNQIKLVSRSGYLVM